LVSASVSVLDSHSSNSLLHKQFRLEAGVGIGRFMPGFNAKNMPFFPRKRKYFVTTKKNSFKTPLLKVLLKLLLKVFSQPRAPRRVLSEVVGELGIDTISLPDGSINQTPFVTQKPSAFAMALSISSDGAVPFHTIFPVLSITKACGIQVMP
jgi:hypothetical protein